eukprot:SAG22_NODE_12840_length_427_cov_1.341463_1_plen_64_part_01
MRQSRAVMLWPPPPPPPAERLSEGPAAPGAAAGGGWVVHREHGIKYIFDGETRSLACRSDAWR